MPHVRICAGGRWVTGVPTATGLNRPLDDERAVLAGAD